MPLVPAVLTDLASSKKFLFTLVTTLIVLAAGWAGALSKAEVLGVLGVLWPVYLGAQGIADVGQKLADGHVAVREMAGEQQATKDAQLSVMIETMTPTILKVIEGLGPRTPPPPYSGVVAMRALVKGDRVVTLADPTSPGEVLEDCVPYALGDVKVRCRFDDAEVLHHRLDLAYVPPGTVLPTKPTAPGATGATGVPGVPGVPGKKA